VVVKDINGTQVTEK